MCGFAGFIDGGSLSKSDIEQCLVQMSLNIVHRGPDSSGTWVAPDKGVGFSHRRLAIQDLSSLGHQPMSSSTGRYVIVFNGEIYNFLELRETLEGEGIRFRGGSDTEVMLAAFEQWGVEKALRSFTGMFAFALWDNSEKILFLARDRVGEKPLYYGWQRNTFLFGSELKAIRLHPDWLNEINRDAITLYMRHNFIPSPYSIFKNIYKLEPGCYLTVSPDRKNTKIHSYWSHKSVFTSGLNDPANEDPEEIVNTLEELLKSSIRRQLISDVPVGAFLSGGIDSSVVVALMQLISSSTVKTFTIGFDNVRFNEAGFAKSISDVLGTNHTELYVTPEETLKVIPQLAQVYDEPFADSSQIPTYLISRLTRNDVTVSLSGDGGDELFCGYTRYQQISRHWSKLDKYSYVLRDTAGHLIKSMPSYLRNYLAEILVKKFTSRNSYNAGEKVIYMADAWQKKSLSSIYQHDISYWKRNILVRNGHEPEYALNMKSSGLITEDNLKEMQYLDCMCYLPDDILVKVDRAAMAHSLETRIPLLDKNIIEYAARIPSSINMMHKAGKWPLREILYKYVPKELVERPKMGFAVPVDEWLKGELKEWAEDLLDSERIKADDIFNPEPVRKIWLAHISGRYDYSFQLWGILMFQSWYTHWY